MNFHAQNEIQILIWNFDDGKIQILMLEIIAARFARIYIINPQICLCVPPRISGTP